MLDCRRIEAFLKEQARAGQFPGAVYALVDSRGLLACGAIGLTRIVPFGEVANVETAYDLASLTKPILTATILLSLQEQGVLSISDPLGRWLPESPWPEIQLEQLLLHTSGLPPWSPLYGLRGVSPVRALFRLSRLVASGKRVQYGCPNFILLGLVLERATGKELRQLAREIVLEPLAMEHSFFGGKAVCQTVAPTEWGNRHEQGMSLAEGLRPLVRHGIIEGAVHDTNAFSLGGLAGNAGLFSTAEDVGKYAVFLLRALGGQNSILRSETVRQMLFPRAFAADEVRSWGWLVRDPGINPSPGLESQKLVGHTGFTGTSLFLAPQLDLGMVLLTNRVHPTVRPTPMAAIRSRFHGLCVQARLRFRST